MSSAPPKAGTRHRAVRLKPGPPLVKSRSPSTLQVALGISLAVHAALLAVRIVDPERFNRVFQDTPLEVILVNSKSSDPLDANAKAIAQASLAGGGALESGRPTSPLPPSLVAKTGDSPEDEYERRQVKSLKEQQRELLLQQTRKELAALPPPDLSVPSHLRAQSEQDEKRRQLVKLLAEIEKSISEDSAQPTRRYISPSTREEVYAVYYDAMRRRIEKKGTLNFPQLAGKKLYGELTMTMTVNADGNVLATEVVQGSGNPLLDRWAQSLVQGSGPFEPFSEAMRGKADQIVVVSSFNFGTDNSLETKLTNR
ncbi:energy transducer TonB [Polaromonas glacialis]|uniref:energy transducer TonB n=1 Tax=Polaromonas glacialis TaxID=866564 RepID=UPI0009FFC731|nr:energy transducer TonB [Polaromonas glacialis]